MVTACLSVLGIKLKTMEKKCLGGRRFEITVLGSIQTTQEVLKICSNSVWVLKSLLESNKCYWTWWLWLVIISEGLLFHLVLRLGICFGTKDASVLFELAEYKCLAGNVPSNDLIPSLFCNCSVVPPMHIWQQKSYDNLHKLQDFWMSQNHWNIA